MCKIEGCFNEVRANGMCRHHYNKWYAHGDPLFKNKWDNCPDICIADGCNDKATRKSAKLCEKHYYRLRRTGSTIKKSIKKLTHTNTAGYIKDLAPEHPLSDSTEYVYRHRKVLYDSNPIMRCVHCNKIQSWSTCHVDHLDDDITNNDLSNLGISCPTCNTSRGHHKAIKSIRNKYAIYEYNGIKLCLSDWGRKLDISCTSMLWRLKHWDDKDRIFTTKSGSSGPKKCHSLKTAREKDKRS